MGNIEDTLSRSLCTGFIDKNIHCNKEYLPKLLVNKGMEGKKVLTTIKHELKTCDEFWISVAFVTTSGVAALINVLDDLEYRNIRGKLLVSQYLNFTQPEALKRLLRYKNIELRVSVDRDLHAKGYLFKKSDIYSFIVGSSNLTASALSTNQEWNLKVTATREGSVITQVLKEFDYEYSHSRAVDLEYISQYTVLYDNSNKRNQDGTQNVSGLEPRISPNKMQVEALDNLASLRASGKSKALLISATGTGKTYLSAFDVKRFNPKKFLFIVHRENIARAAMSSFQSILGNTNNMGIYTGSQKETHKEYLFSTIQTVSREDNLKQFTRDYFDYIVIDETHRAGAKTYLRVMEYFEPKFLLGMTATPERTDGYDVFSLFNHTIAYEIRLHQALKEKMLSPFHYYGVVDITVNGETLEDDADFQKLTSKERVKHIIQKSEYYSSDDGTIRGLVFCSRVDECKFLSDEFNSCGYKTIALSGDSGEKEREEAIERLETSDEKYKIDYIFTVDIFNEGVDIPRVNQIVMLRPTQSAIIFVQQLGRGLRLTSSKEYLTVIDFIGNYNNNYLIPIALYGDTTYSKDNLRKLISNGSNYMPGSSTINFDKIALDRILMSIDTASMHKKRDLINDYNLLKFEIGRPPMMVDFLEHGSRDPMLYVGYSKSYYNFVKDIEKGQYYDLDKSLGKLLELFSSEINNCKRIEESLTLKHLIENTSCKVDVIRSFISSNYQHEFDNATLESCVLNLNFKFINERQGAKLVSANEKYGYEIVHREGGVLNVGKTLSEALKYPLFAEYLSDSTEHAIAAYNMKYSREKYHGGFLLYSKYTRKDVFRIMNWNSNPVAQNVGGYMKSPDGSNCPIFVNYHKEEGITGTTKYPDKFLNNYEFQWMSKSKRTLSSPDVKAILNVKNDMRMPLFIKKSNDEGSEFYYMGDIVPRIDTAKQDYLEDDNGKKVPAVLILFDMMTPVSNSMYDYITDEKIL